MRFTGGRARPIGVVGVFVPEDPGARDDMAKHGQVAFDLGEFWFKGQSMGSGQCPVKRYNQQLRNLIHAGVARPSFIVSHRVGLDEAPSAYEHFDNRDDGWTRVLLKPGRDGGGAG